MICMHVTLWSYFQTTWPICFSVGDMPSSRDVERNGRVSEHRRRSSNAQRSDASGSDIDGGGVQPNMDSESNRNRYGRRHSGSHGRISGNNKKSRKKRHSRECSSGDVDNPVVSVASSVVKPLVEYSDVSSEDLSGPEAGEIQSDESTHVSLSEGEVSPSSPHSELHHSSRNQHKHGRASQSGVSGKIVDSDVDRGKGYRHQSDRKSLTHSHVVSSPPRSSESRSHSGRHVISPILIRSPSPMSLPKSCRRKERRTSVSSVTSLGSEFRHSKHHEHSPSIEKHQHVGRSVSPPMDIYRNMKEVHPSGSRHRSSSVKKREKRHKRDREKKLKSSHGLSRSPNSLCGRRRKKKLKHRSISSSPDDLGDQISGLTPQSDDASMIPSPEEGLVDGGHMPGSWPRPTSPEEVTILSRSGSAMGHSKNNMVGSPISPPFVGEGNVRPPETSDMEIESSEPEEIISPRTRTQITPVALRQRTRGGSSPVSSPHTPPLPPKAYEKLSSLKLAAVEARYSGRQSPSPTDRRSPGMLPRRTPSLSPVPRRSHSIMEEDEMIRWKHQNVSPSPRSPLPRHPSPVHILSRHNASSPSRKRRKACRSVKDRLRSHRRQKDRDRDRVRERERDRNRERVRERDRSHKPSRLRRSSRSRSRSPIR